MAEIGTGKEGVTALAALVENKTIAIAGDGTEAENLRNMMGDATTQVLETIEFEHSEIHQGEHFYFTDTQTISAASSDAVDYLIVSPNTTKWPHLTWDLDGVAITSFYLYEDVSNQSSDGWTAESTYNNNRNSSNDATMLIYSKVGSSDASTDYGTGVPIWEYASGTSTERSNNPSGARATRELILGKGVKYVLRCLSGTASNLVNVALSWYEHTNLS
jgi:hypothetical protein